MALQPWDKTKIAAHPYDEFEATPDDIEYLKKLYKNLPGMKEEPGEDPPDVFRKGIQGELFSRKPESERIRGALKPWTEGINPWDTGGGKMKEMLKPFPALQRIIMNDARAQAPANNIKSTWPWRTRRKDDPRYIREFYDPVTGMSMEDFKAQYVRGDLNFHPRRG